jgi:raffinose/stachyose/melibiose transport system permease protein
MNSFVMLYPVVVMVLSAFKTTGEIFEHPFALPDFTQVRNFTRVLGETSMPTYFVNSIIVTGASILLILTLGTMAGYAIARYESRTNTFILLFFLAGLMLPLKLAIIPLFILLRDLNLLDSRWSLIVTYTAIGLPSAVFIMAGFLRSIPSELEDAARIDGASEPRIMWSVMLPLARPPMAIAAIQNAVPIWNDFFFPLVFIQTDAYKTLPQGLTTFMGEYTTDWGMLFAGLTIAAAPITLLYIALSRQFIQGMTAGAVK